MPEPTYMHCSTEESAQRQQAFEQCLLELMRQTPYQQISVSDICQKMDISRKSFYRYFSCKNGCLYALLDHTVIDYTIEYFAQGIDQPKLEAFFRFWQENRQILELILRDNLMLVLQNRAAKCLNPMRKDLRNPHLSSREDMVFFLCGMMGLLLQWRLTDYRQSPRELAAVVDKLYHTDKKQ